MKPALNIDTSFGLVEFDYINSTPQELYKRKLLEERVSYDIERRYNSKVSASLLDFGKLRHYKFNEELLTCEVGYCVCDYDGPDQSSYSIKGEHNSILIYMAILKTMWNDVKTYAEVKRVIRLRKIIRKNIKDTKRTGFNYLKSWLLL
jgi:hypothetical protein